METRRFSPPEIERLPIPQKGRYSVCRTWCLSLLTKLGAPDSPILISLIGRMPSSLRVSKVRYFFASRLISLGSRNKALYSTVSYTVSVDISVSSWSTKPMIRRNSSFLTNRPLTFIVPLTVPRFCLRARMSRKVDLPAPEAPMIAVAWPGFRCPVMLSRMSRPPRAYETSENRSDAGTWSAMSLAASSAGRRICPKPCVFDWRPIYHKPRRKIGEGRHGELP